MGSDASPDDVLYGVPAIAEAFKLTPRQVTHLKNTHGLPTYKIGKTVCARRGAVAAWLKAQETAATESSGVKLTEPSSD